MNSSFYVVEVIYILQEHLQVLLVIFFATIFLSSFTWTDQCYRFYGEYFLLQY